LSKKLAGSIPRAGDVPLDGPVLVPGRTYAQARSVINDMGLLFSDHVRPPSTAAGNSRCAGERRAAELLALPD
jgi:hypothetical protein